MNNCRELIYSKISNYLSIKNQITRKPSNRLLLWKWIPCQSSTSVLCLLFRPKTVHCSSKNAYSSEITFLALVPWCNLSPVIPVLCTLHRKMFLIMKLKIYLSRFKFLVSLLSLVGLVSSYPKQGEDDSDPGFAILLSFIWNI